MLKLEHLEVNGFKTFVDPVTSRFAPGITAIVGPNGCGKSNLADAITWVLGEQSPKSLRGSSMEDVIFNGSGQRKPLGMAEVSLTFLTDGGIAQAEDGRITIGRRIFRGGEAQYRLNDRTARLKDVRDILMDTGLGIREYSVIEQGRIGMILSGKPGERRQLIEEAAGITRYRNSKRLTELKLKHTADDLLRLNDLITEVERRVRSLKRQAGAARRYRERQESYHELLELVLRTRWTATQEELAQLDADLDAEKDREAELLGRIARRTTELAASRERLGECALEAQRAHRRHAELLAIVEGRQQFVRGAAKTLDAWAEQIENGENLARLRQVDRAQAEEALAALDSSRDSHRAEREKALARVEEDRRRIDDAAEAVEQARVRQQELREAQQAAQTAIDELRRRQMSQGIVRERAVARSEQAAEALSRGRRFLETLDTDVRTVGEQVEAFEAGLAEETEAAARAQAAQEADRSRREEARQALEACREEMAECGKRTAVLRELGARDEELRAEIRAALIDLGHAEPQFLGDVIEVAAGWEDSLDLFLGGLRNAVMLGPDEDAAALARGLAGHELQATLLRPVNADRARSGPARSVPNGDGIVADLGTALGLPDELRSALPHAFLVDGPEAAERLAAQHPGVAFLCRDRLWVEAGRITLRGQRAAPGALGRQRELDDLGRRTGVLDARCEALQRQIEEATDGVRAAAAEGQRIQRAAADIAQDLAVARARLEDLGKRRDALVGDADEAEAERDEAAREIADARSRERLLAADLKVREKAKSSLDGLLAAAVEAVERAREERETRVTAGAGRQGLLDLIEQRSTTERNDRRRIERDLDSWRSKDSEWSAQHEDLAGRITVLEAEAAQAGKELDEALAGRNAAEAAAESARQALNAENELVREIDDQLRKLAAEREDLRERSQELRLRREGRRLEAEHLERDYRNEFARDLTAPDRSGGAEGPEASATDHRAPAPPATVGGEVADLDALEAELQARRLALERTGPVNVLADQEYEEERTRHEFLTGQRTDVEESVQKLRRDIRDLDRTSSERFLAAFREVNEAFGDTFTELFRGGEAEMRLMDENDPLDCGIEITARPPGKRAQSIMLLSGGEKALTAIALLFALFQTRPSPFCILDEVDAPLDDANILRFVHMLQRMSENTQFLVITHNKLTMQVASTLYGVTMEERGVSKIVGVDVDEMHPERQLASA